jgi:uncharacterized protein (DUF1697 family)
MADLRALFEELGYTDVKTVLNSGNVVFTGPVAKAEARIEAGIVKRFGFESRVTVLTAVVWKEIIEGNTLGEIADNPSRVLVTVWKTAEAEEKLKALAGQELGADRMVVGTRAAYAWCPAGFLASGWLETVQKTLKDGVTSRNWATVLKIQAVV